MSLLPWHSDEDLVSPTFQAKWQIVLLNVMAASFGLRLGLCTGPIEGQLFPREAFLQLRFDAQPTAKADKTHREEFR